MYSVLTVLWRNGELFGDKPDRAFFVKCDRTTMTRTTLLMTQVGVGLAAATLIDATLIRGVLLPATSP